MTKNLAILFSGNGSNLENIYKKLHGRVFELRGESCESVGGESFESLGLLGRESAESRGESSAKNRGESNPRPRESAQENRIESAPNPAAKKVKIHIPIAISSRKSAFGVTRCANLGLPCAVLPRCQSTAELDAAIAGILAPHGIDLVVLAGFMKILGADFCAQFRAINIHPSILPLFKGAHALQESFKSDMKIAGVSVHFVTPELDSGALIAQAAIQKIKDESFESFESRIHALEHELYPRAILAALNLAEAADSREFLQDLSLDFSQDSPRKSCEDSQDSPFQAAKDSADSPHSPPTQKAQKPPRAPQDSQSSHPNNLRD